MSSVGNSRNNRFNIERSASSSRGVDGDVRLCTGRIRGRDAKFTGTDSRNADLTGATFGAARFSYRDFTDAHCPDGTVGSWANPCFVIPFP